MWTEVALGSLVALQRGTTYKSAQLHQPGPVLLGLASIARDGGFRRDALKTYGGDSPEKLLVHPGQIFLSLKDVTQSGDLLGSVARVPLDGEVGRLTQDTVRLDVTSDEVDPDFLYLSLLTPTYRAYCRGHATGTTNLGLPREDFLAYPVPLPSLPEQGRIAAVVAGLDDLIEADRSLIETLDLRGRDLCAALTADGEWSTVGDVCSLIETGKRPRGGVAGIVQGTPSVGAESIAGLGRWNFAKTKYVPHDFAAAMRQGRVVGGDVLVYKDGGKPGDFRPKVSMAGQGFPFDDFVINEHVYRVRVGGSLSQGFLYFWLQQSETLADMRTRGTGAAIPGLNRTAFNAVPVRLPSAVALGPAMATLDAMAQAALSLAAEASDLTRTRDELLPLLMSGRIRVAEAEEAARTVVDATARLPEVS